MSQKVAIYARYSSDKQNARSAEDQISVLRTYAERQGWEVVEVYKDPEISGRKTKARPEYQQMVQDAKERQFKIILIEDLDRLSRNLAEMASLADTLKFYNIKICTPNGQVSRTEIIFKGEMAQQYLEDLSAKTRRGLKGKVEQGKSAGRLNYGYALVHDDKGNPLKGERVINEEQAQIVRRIFSEFAEGRGFKEIAVRLNADDITPPRKLAWGGNTIRALLQNKLYIGKLVWNRKQWKWNQELEKRVATTDPDDRDYPDLITHDVPELRIISDELWRQVQERWAAREAAQAERVRKRKHPRDHGGRSPKFLFTGIVRCGVCGGNYSRQGAHYYRCSTYCNRGPKACSNSISVRQDVMEETLLYNLKKELFDPESFDQFKAEMRRTLEQRLKDRNQDTDKLRRELTKVEREIDGIVKLAKMGKASAVLADELAQLEARRERVKAKITAELPTSADLDDLLEQALAKYAGAAHSIEGLAARDVTKGRNLIKALVGGSITLEPTENGGLNARMQGDYGGLIKLVEETAATETSRGRRKVVAVSRTPYSANFRPRELVISLVSPRGNVQPIVGGTV